MHELGEDRCLGEQTRPRHVKCSSTSRAVCLSPGALAFLAIQISNTEQRWLQIFLGWEDGWIPIRCRRMPGFWSKYESTRPCDQTKTMDLCSVSCSPVVIYRSDFQHDGSRHPKLLQNSRRSPQWFPDGGHISLLKGFWKVWLIGSVVMKFQRGPTYLTRMIYLPKNRLPRVMLHGIHWCLVSLLELCMSITLFSSPLSWPRACCHRTALDLQSLLYLWSSLRVGGVRHFCLPPAYGWGVEHQCKDWEGVWKWTMKYHAHDNRTGIL